MADHRGIKAAFIAMILTLSISTGALAVGSGGTGARSLPVGTDVFLGGDYMEIGISATGSFGTESAAPTSGSVFFHPNGTDVRNAPSSNSIGLRSNSKGWGKPDETKDFFLPGAIDEGFLIGWSSAPGDDARTMGVGSQISDEGNYKISGQSTVDMSTNGLLKAVSTGTVDNAVDYSQTVSFAPDDMQFKTDITLTNTTASPIYNLTYVRRFDPDQNILADNYETDNFFLKDEAGIAWTIASTEPLSGKTGGSLEKIDRQTALQNAKNVFCFYANDLRAESVYGDIGFRGIPASRYGDEIYGWHIWSDQAIGHITRLGALAAGESVTFSYYSSLDPQIGSAISKAEDVTILVTKQSVFRTFIVGKIDGTLRAMGDALIAGKKYDELSYQWYLGGSMNPSGGAPISGATSWDYAIPANLPVGDHFYYCLVTDPASGNTVATSVAKIAVVPAGAAIYEISFAPNLADASVTGMPAKQTVTGGQKLMDPGAPVAGACAFKGWYTDAACASRWDFASPVSSSFTLYAGWELPKAPFTVSELTDLTIHIGEMAQFTVVVTNGVAPVYQWQCDLGGDEWYDIPGANQSSHSFPNDSLFYNGSRFRCQVTDQDATIASNGALLTISREPKPTSTPMPTPTPPPPPTLPTPPPPQTGDHTPIGLLLFAMIASGACLIIIGSKKRRPSTRA